MELGLLSEAGLLGEGAKIVTTVDELQVVKDDLPEEEHDFRVDLIVTPDRVVECREPRRPGESHWGD